jgi:hypothetical protein
MRDLSIEEQERLKILTENSVSFTLMELTKTGLGKGILDATGSVRAYLKRTKAHDYDLQGTGAKENGIKIDSIIHLGLKIKKTTASLYRPKAKGKGGDPRIWFYGLHNFTKPNDIISLVYFDDKIQLINISQVDTSAMFNTNTPNPIKELIIEVRKSKSSISDELLDKLRIIAKNGFVKSLVNHDTGVGRTLEKLLGIEMNSSKSPDYKGIELKSFRGSRSNRKGLFGKTPNWELSKFKSRVEILYNTIRATGRNKQGLKLDIRYENDWLVENSNKLDIGDFLVWELEVLRKALLKKHKETFWVTTESKIDDGNEYFLYKLVEHTKNPMVDQFELLIEMGAITLDYPIKRQPDGKVIDKGCNFKLKSNSLDLLFPASNIYNLLE